MTTNQTPPDLDALYGEAAAANRLVAETHAAYAAATSARRVVFRKLRAAGQSMGKMAERLGLSRSRVEQIVSEKKKAES